MIKTASQIAIPEMQRISEGLMLNKVIGEIYHVTGIKKNAPGVVPRAYM